MKASVFHNGILGKRKIILNIVKENPKIEK
jgi:hypothetical protein